MEAYTMSINGSWTGLVCGLLDWSVDCCTGPEWTVLSWVVEWSRVDHCIMGCGVEQSGPWYHGLWSEAEWTVVSWIVEWSMCEEKGVCEVCVSAVCVYLKVWMTAPLASNGPYNDIKLLQILINYSTIHLLIAKMPSEKLSNHLWYLSEDLIGFVGWRNLTDESVYQRSG